MRHGASASFPALERRPLADLTFSRAGHSLRLSARSTRGSDEARWDGCSSRCTSSSASPGHTSWRVSCGADGTFAFAHRQGFVTTPLTLVAVGLALWAVKVKGGGGLSYPHKVRPPSAARAFHTRAHRRATRSRSPPPFAPPHATQTVGFCLVALLIAQDLLGLWAHLSRAAAMRSEPGGGGPATPPPRGVQGYLHIALGVSLVCTGVGGVSSLPSDGSLNADQLRRGGRGQFYQVHLGLERYGVSDKVLLYAVYGQASSFPWHRREADTRSLGPVSQGRAYTQRGRPERVARS